MDRAIMCTFSRRFTAFTSSLATVSGETMAVPRLRHSGWKGRSAPVAAGLGEKNETTAVRPASASSRFAASAKARSPAREAASAL